MVTTRQVFRAAALALLAFAATAAIASDVQRNPGDGKAGKPVIYQDWAAAKAASIKDKKPIFVVFR